METRKDGHIVWEKVDRSHERDTFEKIAGLDAICFNDKAYERLTADTHIYGDIFALKVDGSAVGYAIYGQVWEPPELPDAYISRIGVHPDYRQLGYGLKILERNPRRSQQPSRMPCCVRGHPAKQHRLSTTL